MKLLRPDTPDLLEPIDSFNALTFNGALISKAEAPDAPMERLSLTNSIIEECVLNASKCVDASWHVVEVRGSRCSGIQLQNSVLKNITFKNCKLDLSNFRFAKLTNVVFESCVVNEMDFYRATLNDVSFVDCELEDIEFSAATLKNVDLTESRIVSLKGIASLKGAIINDEQLTYLAPALASILGLKLKN